MHSTNPVMNCYPDASVYINNRNINHSMDVSAMDVANEWLRERIEQFAAAYLKQTDIPPDEAVMVFTHTGMGMKIWFERKTPEAVSYDI